MAGLRARLPASNIQRGSGSVWAIAATTPVCRVPSAAALAPNITALVKLLDCAIFETDDKLRFSNNTHLELRAVGLAELRAAIEKLREMAISGRASGPFK